MVYDHERRRIFLHSGGGCWLIFMGLMFMSFGIIPLGMIWSHGRSGFVSLGAEILTYGMLSTAIVLGLWLATGRTRETIDLQHLEVEKRWTVAGIPWRRTFRRLPELTAVETLRVQHRDNEGDVSYDYQVRLRGKSKREGKDKPVATLWSYSTADAARAAGERLAKFCRLALHDATSGTRIVRAPEALDQPIVERSEVIPSEPPPIDPRGPLRCEPTPQGMTVSIPTRMRPRLRRLLNSIAQPLAFLVYWFAAAWHFRIPRPEALAGKLILFVPPALGLLTTVIAAAWASRSFGPETLRIGREGVSLERGGGRSRSLSVETIEEVEVVPTKVKLEGLMIRSDERTLVAGEGLPADELDRLRGLVLYHLRHG